MTDNVDGATLYRNSWSTRRIMKKIWYFFGSFFLRSHLEESPILQRYGLMLVASAIGFSSFFTTRNGLHYFVGDVRLSNNGFGNSGYLIIVLDGILDFVGGISTIIAFSVESILVISAWHLGATQTFNELNRKFLIAYFLCIAISLCFSIIFLVSGALNNDSKHFANAEWYRSFNSAIAIATGAIKENNNVHVNSTFINSLATRLRSTINLAENVKTEADLARENAEAKLSDGNVRTIKLNAKSASESKIESLKSEANRIADSIQELQTIRDNVEKRSIKVFNSIVLPYLNEKEPSATRTPSQIDDKSRAILRKSAISYLEKDLGKLQDDHEQKLRSISEIESSIKNGISITPQDISNIKKFISDHFSSTAVSGMRNGGDIIDKINSMQSYNKETIDEANKTITDLCIYSDGGIVSVERFGEIFASHFSSMPSLLSAIGLSKSSPESANTLRGRYNDLCVETSERSNKMSLSLSSEKEKAIAAVSSSCQTTNSEWNNLKSDFTKCMHEVRKHLGGDKDESTAIYREQAKILENYITELDAKMSPDASAISRTFGALEHAIPSAKVGMIISSFLVFLPLVCALSLNKFTVAFKLQNDFLPAYGLETTIRSHLKDPTSSREYAKIIEEILSSTWLHEADSLYEKSSFPAGDNAEFCVDPFTFQKYHSLFCTFIASKNARLHFLRKANAGEGKGDEIQTAALDRTLVAWLQEQLMAAKFSRRFEEI